ncbi:MAG: hypothetical protein ACREQ5_20405 [Candidatus Dormibacteria bacterium]
MPSHRATRAKPEPAHPRTRVKGTLVQPDYVLRRMAHPGPSAASKLIGTTPGTLHKARNANLVTKAYELAARCVWHDQGYADAEQVAETPPPRIADLSEAVMPPTSASTVLMLVQVPRGRAAILAKTVEAIGGVVTIQA